MGLHRIAHHVKKVVNRYGVPVVFAAPKKLGQLCSRVSRKGVKRRECQKKHGIEYAKCAKRVVYEVPMACSVSYIGQTGRCFNDRAVEHARAIKNGGTNMAERCARCDRKPSWKETKILGRQSDKTAHDMLEAYFICKKSKECISKTSVNLRKGEIKFLEGCV